MDMSSGHHMPHETKNYHVTHDHTSSDSVVISFASRGFYGAGEPIEEFKGTLSKLGVSCIFVTDKSAQWYNHPETLEVFDLIHDLSTSYKNVAVIGDSMGGCAAIAYSNVARNIDRILTFNPQFSIAKPFIDFDVRYRDLDAEIPHHRWLDFSESPIKSRIRMVFGNNEWEDYIHASMFEAAGFSVVYVDGINHGVPYYLKRHQTGNLLTPVLAAFCDFSRPFTDSAVKSTLGGIATDIALRPNAMRVAAITSDRQSSKSAGENSPIRRAPAPRIPASLASLGEIGSASAFLAAMGIAQDTYKPEVSIADPYNSSVSYAYRTGTFLRVLNHVFFQIAVNFTISGSQGKGDLRISLPFTSGVTGVDGGGTVVFTNLRINWPDGTTQVSAAIPSSSDFLTLRAFKSGENACVIQAGDIGHGDCGINVVGFYIAA